MKDLALEMLRAGCSYREICARTGLSSATIAYHAKRHGLQRQANRPRYDWAAIQAYYDAGHTAGECRERFGFNKDTWTKAVKAGRVRPRDRAAQFRAKLARGQRMARVHAKQHLIEEGLQLLCPNSHSQTDTYAGRRKRRPKKSAV